MPAGARTDTDRGQQVGSQTAAAPHAAVPSRAPEDTAAGTAHSAPAHGQTAAAPAAGTPNAVPAPSPQVKGVAFVTAVIKPLNHELNERFYGWRPND
jgi:hypothetical protein